MSINIWTDSMQHAALLGKPVLFTNWLIQRDIIPDGWYCYDLRGTHKSPSTRTTLVDHAADYHAGTVLSPIPLKHEGTRQKVLSTSERITTLTAELNDGNSKIEEMKAEFNRIVSWSKIFDESPMEVKKMICGYIIKKVSVFRDYRVKIEFNINVEQFLNGIDSIDECATYELPMAQ